MKYFKTSGLWFPVDEPENQVSGTLKFSEMGLHLKLLGSFQGGWSLNPQDYKTIQGVVGDSPYGEFVTLHDGFQKSVVVKSQGIGHEVIRFQRAYVGGDYFPDEEINVKAMRLITTSLYEWARIPGVKGFSLGELSSDRAVVQFDVPDPIRCVADDTALLVGFHFSVQNKTRSTGIRSCCAIDITPFRPMGAGRIRHHFAQKLCDLISFATNRPNAIEEISFTKDTISDDARKSHLLYDRIFRSAGEPETLGESDMLFSLSEAFELKSDIFQVWLEFARNFGPFYTVFFSSLYAEPRYLDERFQRVIFAFSLLCGSLQRTNPGADNFVDDVRKDLLANLPDQNQGYLAHLIPTVAHVRMAIDLGRYLEEHGTLMRQIVPDFDSFVTSVSNTLRYLQTREPASSSPHLVGARLHQAMRTVRLLIKLLVLEQLGFDVSQSSFFIERSREFLELKTLAVMS